ncbi:acyl-CoA-binding protein [Crassisporium funariophilum]|nr:acyl-CoA-binding protein [Crassisporium funariophilum]
MSMSKFDKAVAIIQGLPKDGPVKPSVDDQLFVRSTASSGFDHYQYFKQAKVGDNETTRPGMFDIAGKKKWDAWTSVKGTSKEDAYKKYVDKLLELLKATEGDESKAHIAEIEAA